MSETNGNGNKQLVTWVTGAILTTALTTWAASGKSAQSLAQEAKDKAAAVEAKVDGTDTLTRYRLDVLDKKVDAIWRLLDEERKERKGRER